MRTILLSITFGVAAWCQADKSLPPGTKLPEFTLRDQSDRPRTLADIRGPKGAMLVFYRSADW